VAIQKLPVVFALDRAGVVGADGATHCGAFDIAFIRCLPHCSLLAPSDENECRQALTTAFHQDHPVAVRYPRGAGVGAAIGKGLESWEWGKGVVRRESTIGTDTSMARAETRAQRVAILAFGTLLHPALAAAQLLDATVADMRFVKPLDVVLVRELARTHGAFVTLEEGCIEGGAGSAVLECLAEAGIHMSVLQLGLPDEFVEHGEPGKLLAMLGLDAAGIERSIRQRFGLRPALAAVNS
jgi:1-deoxy-D-xylulose-5-phosphate synthase